MNWRKFGLLGWIVAAALLFVMLERWAIRNGLYLPPVQSPTSTYPQPYGK